MQAPSGQMTAPLVQALLKEGAPGGDWVLDPRKSSIRLKSRAMWGRGEQHPHHPRLVRPAVSACELS